jgi:hypothetical protein
LLLDRGFLMGDPRAPERSSERSQSTGQSACRAYRTIGRWLRTRFSVVGVYIRVGCGCIRIMPMAMVLGPYLTLRSGPGRLGYSIRICVMPVAMVLRPDLPGRSDPLRRGVAVDGHGGCSQEGDNEEQ